MTASVNQWGNSSLNMTVLQCLTAMAIMQMYCASPITVVVAEKLKVLADESIEALKKTIYDSPVICLSAGLGFLTNRVMEHYFGSSVSSTPGFEGSLKVAQFVGAAFLAKSALSPFIKKVIQENRPEERRFHKIQHTAIRYIFPLAITTLAARSYDPQVKAVPSVLFTLTLFGAVNLLGRLYKRAIAHEKVKESIDLIYDASGYSRL